jgi:hypothetical protein
MLVNTRQRLAFRQQRLLVERLGQNALDGQVSRSPKASARWQAASR